MSQMWKCPADRFPIMKGIPRPGEQQITVPLALVLQHEKQAVKNHGQTVARLKERGGLSWSELCAVLEDRPWSKMDLDDAHTRVLCIVLRATP